ncbi:DNA cytosine methyltransferase [Mycoplasma sp. 246B]
MKFVDLFAGIGGFHQAMKIVDKDSICVLASEIDKECVAAYYDNYHLDSNLDVVNIKVDSIPQHDILFAGFPCQAFSKAGKQEGLNDTRGTLFFQIERILKHTKTKYILLENVRNLISHDGGRTWKIIQENLYKLGYRLTKNPLILSPHQFGIPQIRERVYILGKYDPKNKDVPLNISFHNLIKKDANSVNDILDKNIDNSKYHISEYDEEVLNFWNDFYLNINQKVIGFPVYIEYLNNNDVDPLFPKWKQDIIRKNQKLYNQNKAFIDKWISKDISHFRKTHQKFEWQAGDKINNIWEGIIQFRPSGIRVKKPDVFPALVAMVHIPIIGKYKRRLTPRECARLQSFPENFKLHQNDQKAYKQLGNSINVTVVSELIKKLLKQ